MTSSEYAPGDDVTADLELRNDGDTPLPVYPLFLIEDYPILFDIFDNSGARVRFLGPEIPSLKVTSSDYQQLGGGESLTKRINLRFDADRGVPLYDLSAPGHYTVTAVYSPFFQLPETRSETETFDLTP